jgi:CheY-like chemotaxis protein
MKAKAISPPPLGRGEMAKTILVADDNSQIRDHVCRLFQSDEDYDVCAEAVDGQQAIDLALKYLPNLIILDLSMPVMDGLAAARELKALMPDVPIILFTQYADLGKYLFGSDLPVDRVVSKSDPQELVRHVRSLIPA